MKQNRVCLYFRQPPERDRWLPGDRHVRPLIRRIMRGAPRVGGIEQVVVNLRRGLEKLDVDYQLNLPFEHLSGDDRIVVLGRGRYALEGYARPFPLVAGIGLMTHPAEWPTLCEEYPVARYLQHSRWVNDIYRHYFGERCSVWPAGIDTDTWCPAPAAHKTIDFLVYDKIMWGREATRAAVLDPVRSALRARNFAFSELRYGAYTHGEYRQLLARARAMIFLAEHESQGLACQECMASGVPVLAWDQGQWLDPNRCRWGTPQVAATSVPYWDERCGVIFRGAEDFPDRLDEFCERVKTHRFSPRDYVMENLTLELSTRRLLDILESARFA